MDKIVELDNTIINLLSELDFKFWFKNSFYVNFMDYFPLLKQGKCKIDTISNIIVTYMIIMINDNVRHKPIDLINILLATKDENDLKIMVENYINSHIKHIDEQIDNK